MDVETFERCLSDAIVREKGNVVDTVKKRIQNASLTAIDNKITTRIEFAFGSTNACSGRDAASVTANSEQGELIGITASFETVSDRINLFH